MAPPPYLHGFIITSKAWNITHMATKIFSSDRFISKSDQYLKEWEIRGKRAIKESPLDLEEKETCILFVDLGMSINSNFKFNEKIKRNQYLDQTYVIILYYYPCQNLVPIQRCNDKGELESITDLLTRETVEIPPEIQDLPQPHQLINEIVVVQQHEIVEVHDDDEGNDGDDDDDDDEDDHHDHNYDDYDDDELQQREDCGIFSVAAFVARKVKN